VGSNVSVVLRKRRRTVLRRWLRSHPTLRESDIVQFILLLGAALLVAIVVLANPESVPAVAFAPIIVVAGLFLTVPRLIAVYTPIAAVILVIAVLFPRSDDDFYLTPISLVLVMAFMYLVGRSRSRLGTQGFHGDNLLVDLRDRIQRNGALPELPERWRAESALHSANGATQHLYIVNPLKKVGGGSSLFSTHPPIADRINRLRQLTGEAPMDSAQTGSLSGLQ